MPAKRAKGIRGEENAGRGEIAEGRTQGGENWEVRELGERGDVSTYFFFLGILVSCCF